MDDVSHLKVPVTLWQKRKERTRSNASGHGGIRPWPSRRQIQRTFPFFFLVLSNSTCVLIYRVFRPSFSLSKRRRRPTYLWKTTTPQGKSKVNSWCRIALPKRRRRPRKKNKDSEANSSNRRRAPSSTSTTYRRPSWASSELVPSITTGCVTRPTSSLDFGVNLVGADLTCRRLPHPALLDGRRVPGGRQQHDSPSLHTSGTTQLRFIQ